MYVSELVIAGTVMGATLTAFADHGTLPETQSRPTLGDYGAAVGHLEALAHVGVDFPGVTDTLEREGLTKFEGNALQNRRRSGRPRW